MKDRSGELLDHYYIVERVKESIEGDLYIAYDRNPPESAVSLLLVGEAIARNPEFKNHFQQAMDRSQQLNDPSLLRILNYGIWSKIGVHYVVTEQPHGYTLREILDDLHDKNNVLKLTDIVEIVREVCTAIELVRLNQLPSRDLSPDNILENIKITWATPSSFQPMERSVFSELRVLVTDLGLGRIGDSSFTDNTRSEIYALGKLLYRLVLGEDQGSQQRPDDRLTPPRILRPALPRSIERIILTASANNPQERYDSPGYMAIDLTNTHWEAQQFDLNAPSRDLAIDLGQWLAKKAVTANNREYIQIADELLLPAVPPGYLDLPSHKDVRLETLKGAVDVVPGGRAEVALRLVNMSQRDRVCWIRIDHKPEYITIDVTPASVRLGASGSIDFEKECKLIFQPSADPLCPAGLYRIPIAIIYNQNNVWIDSDKLEIILSVTRVQKCAIDVWPRTLEAGQVGQVVVSNHGNTAESLLLSLAEPLGKLAFDVEDATTDRAIIILDAGESGQISFSPKLRRPHWWGKERLYPFKIEIITPEQKRLEATECQAVSRRRIPLWPILFAVIGCLFMAIIGLFLFRPTVSARDCSGDVIVSRPSVALCVTSYTTVNSLSVFPGDVPLNLDAGKLILPAPAPDELQNTVRLEANNALTRILPFLAYRQDLTLPVRKPQPTTIPTPKVVQFCVGDADHPERIPACSTPDKFQSLPLTRGQTQTLLFSWQTENANGQQVELLPQTIPFKVTGSSATAPMPANPLTYTLALVDAMGGRSNSLSVVVRITDVRAVVAQPLLYLHKSPGKVYETVAVLKEGTEVVLLTQPLDYQQNEDFLHWVKVIVAATNETGWAAIEGLQVENTHSSAGTSPTELGNSSSGGATSSVNPGDSGNASNSGGNAGDNAHGSNNGNIGGIASAGSNSGTGALANLPAMLPEFGPTVTPTPTPTATETPTPEPTATPAPTNAPLRITVEIKPTEISNCEEVTVSWNIEGAKEVYFDYGRGPFDLIEDNRYRSETLRHGIDFGLKHVPENSEARHDIFILFRWKVVLFDGAERIITKQLLVHNKEPAQDQSPCRFVPEKGD